MAYSADYTGGPGGTDTMYLPEGRRAMATFSWPSHFDEGRSAVNVPRARVLPDIPSYFDDIHASRHVGTHGDRTTGDYSVLFDRASVGMSLEQGQYGVLYVQGIVPGGPADMEGIKCGDALLQVDGISVFGQSLQSVHKRLHGPPGTTVALRIGIRPFHFDRPLEPERLRDVVVRRSHRQDAPPPPQEPVVVRTFQPRTGDITEAARRVFREFDANDSGKISRKEFQQATEKLGLILSDTQSQTYFESIDRDHSGKITEDEFADWFYLNRQSLFAEPVVRTIPVQHSVQSVSSRQINQAYTVESYGLSQASYGGYTYSQPSYESLQQDSRGVGSEQSFSMLNVEHARDAFHTQDDGKGKISHKVTQPHLVRSQRPSNSVVL